MDHLEAYEDLRVRSLVRPAMYKRLNRSSGMRFSPSVRKWMAINTIELLDPTFGVINKKAKRILTDLFYPPDYLEATIHNSFYLRFPDFSYTFPLRCIRTDLGIHWNTKVSIKTVS